MSNLTGRSFFMKYRNTLNIAEKDLPGQMAIMKDDGCTYDAYGNFSCKTHASQRRPQRESLLWKLEEEDLDNE